MTNELAGKVAIITGGASGLGCATVRQFVAAGARVVIADLDDQRGPKLAAECGRSARFERIDVSDAGQMAELTASVADELGGLHVMVNNAGIAGTMHANFLDDDLADFDRLIAVNLRGVMLGTREAARQMSQAGGGSIVNMSSIGGIRAGAGVMTYRAAKAAVLHFTKCAAMELAQHGVRVNCIAPGGIPTPILASSAKQMSDEARDAYVGAWRDTMRALRPLECEGTPEDVAEAALYLASDRSRYVTGTVLPVDGGIVVGMPTRIEHRG
ncbi:oxidoreductase [Mycobacterium mantenii]|uniref:Oxidoreductase n=1 Tax=Mycobacterium mantenii TaxID=560555 RepID=A0A1X0FSX9_MYCNT|nr:SDR family NAD(P)-dependent oxidoreductase [Mycobacterium mantenii]MCV7243578.1 SDR family oxidoreductase [Mycobacterium mantenii]ORB04877.1 oxidoreductase [Mycobacterium mantenii]BBY38088.1 oxidoreductase [Mycobacterium mantenii]